MQLLKQRKSDRGDSFPRKGFTLPELLVVLVILSLLAVMLLPARADSRTKSKSIRCVDNLREIMQAMMMYTHDNHDLFPPNPDDSNTVGHNWCQGDAGRNGMDEFNADILMDPQKCLITTYINTNVSLFRCTADTRVGTYQGTDPSKIGTKVPAARSISMSQAVGTICVAFDTSGQHSGKPVLSVKGAWLDNNHSNRRNSPWRTYGKLSETVIPGPARLWVLIEEDVNSLNDGGMAVGMQTAEWIDWPATRHAMGCTVTFADGHVELHKWANRSTIVPVPVARRSVPGSADWAWLADRTSARAQ
jgi:prepilin-type N-terminal cleavage/methylation domain-containing protein/prepilin-type processing-associated H-X9-DG protein